MCQWTELALKIREIVVQDRAGIKTVEKKTTKFVDYLMGDLLIY